jgi:DNA polymerase-3 subunit alpha
MYGFNKSHSAAYALISFQTAYLKAHYPEEFLAGLLTLEMSDTDKTFKNIAECRDRGIRVLPPDVNESREDFTVMAQPDEGGLRPIRFGLGAVRGVGSKAVEAMLAARDGAGPFTSLADFCKRTQGGQVNKKVVESLIKCGAFDSLGAPRRQLLDGVDKTLLWATKRAGECGTPQIGFGFQSESPEPALPEAAAWPDKEMLKAEHEALGFYITAHPLDKYEADLKRFTNAACEQLSTRDDQTKVSVGGVIQGLKLRNSRKGDRYASFTLEDKSGTVEVIAWPETYRKCESVFSTDEPVCVVGTLEVGEERCQIIADEVVPLVAARARSTQEVHFALRAERVTEETLRTLRATLAQYRGECPAYLHLLLPNQTETIIALPRDLRVAPTEGMVEAVEQLLGRGVASLQ